MKRNPLLTGTILICMLFTAKLSFCQNKINGTIADENDNPLQGATVQIKGSGEGTTTDA
jgi:carbon monoxide dehydrogenase subunit G